MIGIRQGKAWGYTTKIFESQSVEVYDLEIVKGGYCSVHQHRKINIFHVLSGKLIVRTWIDGKLTDASKLESGQTTAVYAGFDHQFEALEETRCIEVYHIFIEPGDIERKEGSEGGIRNANDAA